MLVDVYAVHVQTDSYGDRYWVPRSQALPTPYAPRLWSSRRDAERWAVREQQRGHSKAKVVRFRLEEVRSDE